MSSRWLFPLCLLAFPSLARADGAADNQPEKVRSIPPKGVGLTEADSAELKAGLDKLGQEIVDLRTALKTRRELLELLPDVQIYEKAVRSALTYNEFFNVREVSVAKKLLEQGLERARQLREGKAPWNTATGSGRARLCLEDRRLGPAVWPGRAGLVPAEHAASVPARCLVPRPRRNAERAELHQWPAVVARRVHAAECVRRASLRPILQRQQVRRRDRPVRGDRGHQEALPDRRRPPGDAGLLDGGRRLLAVRRPLSRACGSPRRRVPASPRRPTS